MFKELVSRTRSIRRYDASVKVDEATLKEVVELARLSPSSANLQPLKFKLVTEPSQVEAVFNSIRFAAYLKRLGWTPTRGKANCLHYHPGRPVDQTPI